MIRLTMAAGLLALSVGALPAWAQETPAREIVSGADFVDLCTKAGRALSSPPGDGSRPAARQCKDYLRNFFTIENSRPVVPTDQVMCINGKLSWQEITDQVLDWGKGRSEFDDKPAGDLVRAAMRAKHPCTAGN
jgi:hypothetical protein